jgi:glycosyltransferase involved in cell wall biosynthesis
MDRTGIVAHTCYTVSTERRWSDGGADTVTAMRQGSPSESDLPLRVLLSAFSCEPGKGSEPEVGLRTLLAAAERHDVWVLTSESGMPKLQPFLARHRLGSRIRLEPIPFGINLDGLSLMTFHRYYERWQRRAGARALQLDRQVGFDVVHHATMSTVWTRVGVAAVPKPLVWGPVGGGVESPLRLLPELGLRGFVDDMLRVTSRRLLAQLPATRRVPKTAAVVFAQNCETVRRLRARGKVIVLPNATVVQLDPMQGPGDRTSDLALVGRIVGWKGGHLAMRAFRYVTHPEAVLRVYGEGPDRARLEQAARRWGLADRVRFEGWLPRTTLLPRIARAGVLVHPSFHDDAPLSVAEALSFGTPVVCLEHGGPAEVARRWPDSPSCLIAPTGIESTARRMAEAIDRFLRHPPPVRATPARPDVSFADTLLDAYDQAARITQGVA